MLATRLAFPVPTEQTWHSSISRGPGYPGLTAGLLNNYYEQP